MMTWLPIDERETMTQTEWDEVRLDLERHLAGVEERFWLYYRQRNMPLPPPPQTDNEGEK